MASKKPTVDAAEHNAYFPSDYSLGQYVPPTTDFDGAKGAPRVSSGPRKILTILTDERYLELRDGVYFSTGNHPVETLLPLMHLQAAGYEVEVATLSGNMAKFELWAMPEKDEAVHEAWDKLLPQIERPRVLGEIAEGLDASSDYAAVFIPGGHGATINLAESREVGRVLQWALDQSRPVITLCHGPAALLSAVSADGKNLFAGYSVAVFPDALDSGPNIEIGYLPGTMTWLVAEELTRAGLTVVNDDMTGLVHKDRTLLTGDSPLASNALGRLAVETLTGASYTED
ncbi:glyoxalase III HchA [Kocuria sp.]|uniref:glyoxalase III HchA n=1 Tax=Kocuria sp. TaxID=1871328 RepID=UPI0026DCC104|nr:glyoxalase III HchA [Kocuria sp.]MDO4918942.1 protein deglycase HchA [Kocuria sp.]